MTLREELLDIIRHLPEDALEEIAPTVRHIEKRHVPKDWQESLVRARAFRARVLAKYGPNPSSDAIIEERREEHLRDITGHA
jgi:hypothetical protein